MSWALVGLLMLAAAAAEAPGPGPLIDRLVSPHSAERSAAAEALERMGAGAVPALREARLSPDLELRARAAALLDAIEGRALALPTLVTLDFRDRPIAEVVAAVAERGRASIALEPAGDDRWTTRRISLEAAEPLPFWEALDRLCRAGGLRLTSPEESGFRVVNRLGIAGGPQPRMQPGQELVLVRGDGSGDAPTVDHGAFRVSLVALHHERNRSFFANPTSPRGPSESVRFVARLQVRVEPRLALVWVGPPRQFEAIDDRGQRLPAESVPVAPPPLGRYNGRPGTRPDMLEVVMKYPERPGKAIERLGGTVPVVIACRRPDPLVVHLGAAPDRAARSGGTTLVIHDLRPLPDRRGTAVELTLTIPELSSPVATSPWPAGARSGLRLPPLNLPRLEFADAQGRVCHSLALGPYHLGDGRRKTINVVSPEGTGPPVEVRYHELTWATVEVPFAFENLPMP